MRADVVVALAVAGVLVLAELGVRLSVAPEELPQRRASADDDSTPSTAAATPAAGSELRHRRRGRPPRLRFKKPRQGGPCELTVDARPLRPISDRRLIDQGLGAISPIEARFDGAPLDLRLEPSEGCAGAAWFEGREMHIRAPREGLAPEQLELSLSEALPLETAKGPVWWVYPRTTLDAVLPDGAVTGAVTVAVSARSVAGAEGVARLSAFGTSAPLTNAAGDRVQATVSGTLTGGALVVSVEVPPDAPYLVIESLIATAGEAEHSLLSEATP